MDEHKAVISYSSDREYETFSGWTKTFTDPRLWAAIVDRLPFKGLSPKRAQTPTDSPIRWPSKRLAKASRMRRYAGVPEADRGLKPELFHYEILMPVD